PVTRAQSAGSFHIFTIAGGEHLGANQASVAHPTSQREGENKIENSRATKCDEGNRQQNSRKRQKGIHHDYVHETVNLSTVVARDGTKNQSEKKRSGDDTGANQHGNSRSIDQ